MNTQAIQDAANALIGAAEQRVPVSPLSERWPDLTMDDAYAVQIAQIARKTDDGEVVKGHKVGLTSLAMQRMLGVDQPDYGHLLAAMFIHEHELVPCERFLQPRVEPEFAFVLGSRLAGPGVTVADAVRSVECVLPSLEIIDSRIRDWKITLADTIADNASSGGVVLGAQQVPLAGLDLRLAGCVLERNGVVEATGTGAAVLGNPLSALVWLANTLGSRGVALEPGHVVLPGSCTVAIPVEPGDQVQATFAGLGTVRVRFAEQADSDRRP